MDEWAKERRGEGGEREREREREGPNELNQAAIHHSLSQSVYPSRYLPN